jgi:hypothetical protein
MKDTDPRAGRPFDPHWRRFYPARKSRFRPLPAGGFYLPEIAQAIYFSRWMSAVEQVLDRSNLSILPKS